MNLQVSQDQLSRHVSPRDLSRSSSNDKSGSEDAPKPLSRKNSWFAQVKQREAKLAAAEDKALAKKEAQQSGKKSGFLSNISRRLSTSSRERRGSDASTGSSIEQQSCAPRMTLNRNPKRKRPSASQLQGTNLRRVCFQLDELVELRIYQQVEADEPAKAAEEKASGSPVPTVRDMETISPYADTTPLDRADLYLQCCRVYKTQPHDSITRQLRGKGPAGRTHEGPRVLHLVDLKLDYAGAVALADTLGLPLTGKHLIDFSLERCELEDSSLQLLLSCLFTAAKLEVLKVIHCTGLSRAGIESLACFVCLTTQLDTFHWAGKEMEGYGTLLIIDVLADKTTHALSELQLADMAISEDELQSLATAILRCRVRALLLPGCGLTRRSIVTIGETLQGSDGLRLLDLSRNDLAGNFEPIIDALNEDSALIFLTLSHCNIGLEDLRRMFQRLPLLKYFRILDVAGHDMRPLMPTLRKVLPEIGILRRLGLGHCSLQPNDVVTLCSVLAKTKISQLILTGAVMDVTAGSALLALVQVSNTLINIELELPGTPVGEKIVVRILAKMLQNMEKQEASTQLTETDVMDSVRARHAKLHHNRAEVNRATELEHGAQGVVGALGHILDQEAFDNDPEGIPRELLDRARHIRDSIEPALAEHHDQVQKRRLQLVSDTLDDVIARVESIYPEWKQPEPAAAVVDGEDEEVFEHSGRKSGLVRPRHPDIVKKSRKLEVEEGEMMKLSSQMSRRLSILRSASATPSEHPSPGELADEQEAKMLEEAQSMADGHALKARLLQLQKNVFHRALGEPVVDEPAPQSAPRLAQEQQARDAPLVDPHRSRYA